MNYDTFESKPNPVERMDSDSSKTTSISRDHVSVFHSVVRTKDSFFGKLRVPSDLENREIVFLVLATLSTFGVIGMTIYRISHTVDKSDSTLGVVVLVNLVFCLGYIYHGVFGERPYQLWAFMIAIVSIVAYSIVQFAVEQNTVMLVRLIVVLVFSPIDLFLCFKISMQHYTSKNLIIRTLRSANINFQNMCMNMFIFQALLILEFEMALSLIVLVLTSGVGHVETSEIVILAVGIFVMVLWFIVGYFVPKYEKKLLLYCFLILSLPQPAYVLYKIVKTGRKWNDQSNTINVSIIICACLFLVIRCLVTFYLWIVVRNFKKGLREAVYFPQEKVEEETVGDQEKSSQNRDKPDDYLGENVNYDIHE